MPALKSLSTDIDEGTLYAPYIPLYVEPTYKKDELLFQYKKSSSIGDFTKFTLPVVRKTWANLILTDAELKTMKNTVQLELFDEAS